jgi:hypothetical protein
LIPEETGHPIDILDTPGTATSHMTPPDMLQSISSISSATSPLRSPLAPIYPERVPFSFPDSSASFPSLYRPAPVFLNPDSSASSDTDDNSTTDDSDSFSDEFPEPDPLVPTPGFRPIFEDSSAAVSPESAYIYVPQSSTFPSIEGLPLDHDDELVYVFTPDTRENPENPTTPIIDIFVSEAYESMATTDPKHHHAYTPLGEKKPGVVYKRKYRKAADRVQPIVVLPKFSSVRFCPFLVKPEPELGVRFQIITKPNPNHYEPFDF